jgi:predicted RNA-binding protein with PUA-like domain
MANNYWLVKQEPEAYSWDQFVRDGRTAWTGVRNFLARNHLRAMREKDLVLYYHSVSDKQVVGIARVARAAYADPTAQEGDWSCVDLVPFKPLRQPVTLAQIKADKVLKGVALVKQGRLSVMPLSKAEYERILELAG